MAAEMSILSQVFVFRYEACPRIFLFFAMVSYIDEVEKIQHLGVLGKGMYLKETTCKFIQKIFFHAKTAS